MNSKQKLLYLIDLFHSGKYDAKSYADNLISTFYDSDSSISDEEKALVKELVEYSVYFSPYEEDYKIYNGYKNSDELFTKTEVIYKKLLDYYAVSNLTEIHRIFEFGNYTIDADIEKTRKFYSTGYEYDCHCPACKNFREYAKNCPEDIRSWFNSLGLDIEKPGEVYYNFEEKDGLLRYDGWWHMCGRVLKTDRRIETREDGIKCIITSGYQVSPILNVSFQNDCVCLPSDFPSPEMQMEVTIYIPRLIDEKIN